MKTDNMVEEMCQKRSDGHVQKKTSIEPKNITRLPLEILQKRFFDIYVTYSPNHISDCLIVGDHVHCLAALEHSY